MNKIGRLAPLAMLALLGACVHPITIVPKMEESAASGPMVQKSVAYLISSEDKDRQVTAPTGGGDSITYYPYRDLETGIFQVLNSMYSRVTLIRTESDEQALTRNNVSLILVPKITTTSSSKGAITWPPTDFSVTLDYFVRDRSGKMLYRNTVTGNGQATYGEYHKEFGLAGRRAAEDALKKFRDQVQSAPELR